MDASESGPSVHGARLVEKSHANHCGEIPKTIPFIDSLAGTPETVPNVNNKTPRKPHDSTIESEQRSKPKDGSHSLERAKVVFALNDTEPVKTIGNIFTPSELSFDEGTLPMIRLPQLWLLLIRNKALILKAAYEPILLCSAPFVAC